MRVLDASVAVDALSGRGARGIAALRSLRGSELIAPAHFDLEVLSAWRRLVGVGQLSDKDAIEATWHLASLSVRRVPHAPLLARIWELRGNVTPADAAYVALAEDLDAPLLTTDVRLTRATGPRCEFQLIE